MSYYELPRFKKLLMQRYGISSIEEVKNPLSKMYLDFALSTVWRGELVKNIISRHIDIKGKKYLDVGCAYGGFLVVFEKAGAIDVVGIDINEQLLDYSRAVIDDCNLNAQIFKKDILNLDEISELGKFDLITCNDVIEHVDYPKTALENMVSMLNENGMIFMQIPNRFSASFIKSDGHFQLFGITVLPKQLADKYYNEIYSANKHDVTYKSLNYYINNLNKSDMECSVINSIEEDMDQKLRLIDGTFEECERNIQTFSINLPLDLKDVVIKRVLRMSNVFKQQYKKYLNLKYTDKSKASALADKLILKFGVDFWILLAKKPN